jgi:hypothetical protein
MQGSGLYRSFGIMNKFVLFHVQKSAPRHAAAAAHVYDERTRLRFVAERNTVRPWYVRRLELCFPGPYIS